MGFFLFMFELPSRVHDQSIGNVKQKISKLVQPLGSYVATDRHTKTSLFLIKKLVLKNDRLFHHDCFYLRQLEVSTFPGGLMKF